MTKWFCQVFILMGILTPPGNAGTHYQLMVPSRPLPYCELMPFDYVDRKIIVKEVYNRLYVNQPVKLEFARNDAKPLTGLQLWSPAGRMQPTQTPDRTYGYQLFPLGKGKNYELRGILKFPAQGGFTICVKALGH